MCGFLSWQRVLLLVSLARLRQLIWPLRRPLRLVLAAERAPVVVAPAEAAEAAAVRASVEVVAAAVPGPVVVAPAEEEAGAAVRAAVAVVAAAGELVRGLVLPARS